MTGGLKALLEAGEPVFKAHSSSPLKCERKGPVITRHVSELSVPSLSWVLCTSSDYSAGVGHLGFTLGSANILLAAGSFSFFEHSFNVFRVVCNVRKPVLGVLVSSDLTDEMDVKCSMECPVHNKPPNNYYHLLVTIFILNTTTL